MTKVISIANQKGGVGKTTTCVNVSAFLAVMGKKVLVVDIDPQGNATSGFGIVKRELKASVYNVLTGDSKAKQVILPTSVQRLHILPSNIDLAGAEIDLVSVSNREKVLRTALTPLRNIYDYILIDCPPSLSLLTVNALTASDSILIPIPGEFYALEGLSQLMNTVRLAKKILNPTLDIEGVVLTLYDGRSNLVSNVTQEIMKYFGKKVFTTRIPRNIRLGEAPSYGMPIVQYDPRCVGSLSYKALTEELLTRNGDTFEKLTNLSQYKVKRKKQF